MSKALLKLDKYVQSVSIQVGRAELGEDTMGTHFSELIVALKPVENEETESVRGEINKALALFPGVKCSVLPFLEERIEETIAGARAEVAVRIYGNDLDTIDHKAEEVEQLLRSLRGSGDVRFHHPEET